MKDSLTQSYFVRMGVPDKGIPIYSDLDFSSDDPEKQATEMMKTAYSDGAISGWTLWKVTRTVRYERVDGEGEEDL